MILQLEKNEMAALVLHMSIMRKNIRKGFKSNYGSDYYKKHISSYDEVKNTVGTTLESMGDTETYCHFNFNIREIDMLLGFLEFYINKVNEEIGQEKMSVEDSFQICLLKSVLVKVEILKVA